MDTRGRACFQCGVLKPHSHFQKLRNGNIHLRRKCRRCRARGEVLAQRKAIAKASREISSLISKSQGPPSADMHTIIDRLKTRLGGAEAIADMLIEDFGRVRGEGLTDEEKGEFEFKEQVIQRYYQMLLKSIAEKDAATSAADLTTLSDEDLRAILAPVAMDLLKRDEEFRDSMLIESGIINEARADDSEEC